MGAVVVEQALQCVPAGLRAGATMGDIDRDARDTISDAGYPEFHCRVGHGVGLAVHEAPWLCAHSDDLCAADIVSLFVHRMRKIDKMFVCARFRNPLKSPLFLPRQWPLGTTNQRQLSNR